MKISVKIKPNAKIEKIQKVKEGEFVLSVKAPTKEGRANDATLRLLSEYFALPKNRINILKGHTSRNKIIELLC